MIVNKILMTILMLFLWVTLPIAFGEPQNVTMIGPTKDYTLVVDVPDNFSLTDVRPTEIDGITIDSICVSRYGLCDFDSITISTSIITTDTRAAIAFEKLMSQIEKENRINSPGGLLSDPWQINNHPAKVYYDKTFSAIGAVLGIKYYGGYIHNETTIVTFHGDLPENEMRSILNGVYLI